MPSGAWSSERTNPSPGGWSWWARAALAIFGGGAILTLVAVAHVQAMRARAWPIVRRVAERLQTDAAALDLYRANPELGARYGSEEAYLEQVRTYHAQFASLPEMVPEEGDAYRCAATPNSFQVWLKGNGGGWLHLFVQGPSYFNQVRGEGLHRLTFAATREALAEEDRTMRRARAEEDWKRFRETTARLATEEGSRALWKVEPGLAQRFQSENLFLKEVTRLRPFLEPLPESNTFVAPRFQRKVLRGRVGEDRELAFAFEGGTLRLTWQQDRLTGIGFDPRGDH